MLWTTLQLGFHSLERPPPFWEDGFGDSVDAVVITSTSVYVAAARYAKVDAGPKALRRPVM